jgi:hypothetical protein
MSEFPYDRQRMMQAVQDMATDLVKLPGQAGLGKDEKFALTMMMLTRLNSAIIASQNVSEAAMEQLLGIVMEQTRLEMRIAAKLIRSAQAMGFGTTLPWSILSDYLQKEDE